MSAAEPIQRRVAAEAAPISPAAAGQVGGALQQLGDQGQDFAVAMGKAQQQHDLIQARLSATKQLDDLSDQFRTDQDPDTMARRYSDASQKIGQDIGKSLDGNAALEFQEDFGALSESRLRNIKDLAFGRQVEQTNASLDDTIETNSRAAAFAANPAERATALSNIQKGINGTVATGMLSAEAGEKKFQSAKERLALWDGKNAVFHDPKSALGNLQKPDYLPDLDPIARIELTHSAEAELKSREREARERLSEARITAELAAQDLHTVVASGEHPAQSIIDNAVATARAAGDPRALQRVKGLVQAVGFADSMRGASTREVDAGIAALTDKANKDGATPEMAAALTAARAYREKMGGALAHDPLMWGQTQGIISLAPLKLDGTDPPAAFQQRSQQAAQVSRRFGVPFQPFTQAESETLKTRLTNQQDPNQQLMTLQSVVHGFGADAVPVLGKLGASDPTLANAGTLVAAGPAYVSTARDVLTGKHLLADKANEGLRPTTAARSGAGAPAMLSAFALLPDTRTAIQDGADAIFATQAARQGLRGADVATTRQGRTLYQKALQLAAGARYEADGTQWGGTANYRANSALVPSNIKADDFEDIVSRLRPEDLTKASVNGHSPTWEGQDPPDNLTRKTWLISGGNGVYGLSATDPSKGAITPVLDRSGQPFRFRFGTAQVAMQARTGAR